MGDPGWFLHQSRRSGATLGQVVVGFHCCLFAGLPWAACLCSSQTDGMYWAGGARWVSQQVTEWCGLEGNLKEHLVPTCCGRGHLPTPSKYQPLVCPVSVFTQENLWFQQKQIQLNQCADWFQWPYWCYVQSVTAPQTPEGLLCWAALCGHSTAPQMRVRGGNSLFCVAGSTTPAPCPRHLHSSALSGERSTPGWGPVPVASRDGAVGSPGTLQG